MGTRPDERLAAGLSLAPDADQATRERTGELDQVDLIARGDRRALAAYYETRAAGVLAYCSRLCAPQRIAEAVEVSFARLFEAVGGGEVSGDAALDARLRTAVRFTAAEHSTPAGDGDPAPLRRLLERFAEGQRGNACELMPRLLAAHAECALSSGDEERLRAHLRRCGDCRLMQQRFDEAERALDALVPDAAPAVGRSLLASLVDDGAPPGLGEPARRGEARPDEAAVADDGAWFANRGVPRSATGSREADRREPPAVPDGSAGAAPSVSDGAPAVGRPAGSDGAPAVGRPAGTDGAPAVGRPSGSDGAPAVGRPAGSNGAPAVGRPAGTDGAPAVGRPAGSNGAPAVGRPAGTDGAPAVVRPAGSNGAPAVGRPAGSNGAPAVVRPAGSNGAPAVVRPADSRRSAPADRHGRADRPSSSRGSGLSDRATGADGAGVTARPALSDGPPGSGRRDSATPAAGLVADGARDAAVVPPAARTFGALAQMAGRRRVLVGRLGPLARRRLSIALAIVGLFLVSEAALTLLWKEPITSYLASRSQDALRAQLTRLERTASGGLGAAQERSLTQISDLRTRTDARIALLASKLGARAPAGQALGTLRIARIGIEYVVVQGTDDASLRKGPGHYGQTPLPGAPGTVGIAGHRTTYLAPFRNIDALKRGDPIVVTMPYGRFSYSVEGERIVRAGRSDAFQSVGHQELVLSACHPLYSSSQRILVMARLVSRQPLGAALPSPTRAGTTGAARAAAARRTAAQLQALGAREMALGMSGPDVRELQRLLGVPRSGYFGYETEGAVTDFQRGHGLAPNGVAGAQTKALLARRQHAPLTPPTPPAVAPQPSSAPSGGSPGTTAAPSSTTATGGSGTGSRGAGGGAPVTGGR